MAKGKEGTTLDCGDEGPISRRMSCCKVDAVVAVDGRGQVVLPKDLREKANIKAGDKLAVISWQRGGEVCCLTLIKTDSFAESIKEMLGPMMKEMLHQSGGDCS